MVLSDRDSTNSFDEATRQLIQIIEESLPRERYLNMPTHTSSIEGPASLVAMMTVISMVPPSPQAYEWYRVDYPNYIDASTTAVSKHVPVCDILGENCFQCKRPTGNELFTMNVSRDAINATKFDQI